MQLIFNIFVFIVLSALVAERIYSLRKEPPFTFKIHNRSLWVTLWEYGGFLSCGTGYKILQFWFPKKEK